MYGLPVPVSPAVWCVSGDTVYKQHSRTSSIIDLDIVRQLFKRLLKSKTWCQVWDLSTEAVWIYFIEKISQHECQKCKYFENLRDPVGVHIGFSEFGKKNFDSKP